MVNGLSLRGRQKPDEAIPMPICESFGTTSSLALLAVTSQVKIMLMNNQEIINKIDFSKIKWNEIGLVPCIVQDYKDKEILMVAFMNKESLEKTLDTKETYFYSRSRNELWHKGHKSGEVQKVKELYYDCDNDTILVKVEQISGVACHTGKRSCFFNKVI